MSWRTTAILFIILLIVAAFVVLQNQQDDAETISDIPTPIPPKALFPDLSGNDVQRVDIERTEDGVIATYERQDDGTDWYRTVPTYTLAVSQTLVSRLSGLVNIATRNNVIPSGSRLADFGLDNPAYIISFVVPDNDKMIRYRIFVGDQTPTGSNYYVRKEGDPRVFVILNVPLENIINFLDTPPIPEPTQGTPVP